MEAKLAIVSHPLARTICKQLIREKKLEQNVKYFEGVFGDVQEIIDQLKQEKEFDVIVTGWGHAAFLQELGVPLVLFNVTGFDILNALAEAKSFTNKVVIMRYGSPFLSIERYSRLVDMQIISSFYQDRDDAIDKIGRFFASGCRTFIGTSLMCDLVKGIGGRAIYVYSRDSISNALNTGWQLAQSRRTEIEKREQFRAILENVREGIIAMNENRECLVVNSQAEKMLGKKRANLIQRRMEEFWPTETLQECIERGEGAWGAIERINQRKYLVDYVPNFVNDHVSGMVITFQDFDTVQKAEQKIRQNLNERGQLARYRFSDIIGSSQAIRNTIDLAQIFARNDSTVLITGESGTGKELFAQSIHAESKRKHKPFIAVNCATLSENLLESELFGYEEGAFTGAKRGGHPGLFEVAHEGTLYLDEIGEISLEMQARLLRVLQEKQIRRMGGHSNLYVDVRIIAATNRDLKKMVSQGSFRRDLYYRLNVLRLVVPPLRQRPEDVRELVSYFCEHDHTPYLTGKIIQQISASSQNYGWPGNIRELENLVERLIVLQQHNNARNTKGLVEMVLNELTETDTESENLGLVHSDLPDKEGVKNRRRESEREEIIRVLQHFNGNKTKAARHLEMSRSTLWKKIKS